jgi:hypothetical protein
MCLLSFSQISPGNKFSIPSYGDHAQEDFVKTYEASDGNGKAVSVEDGRVESFTANSTVWI